MKNRNLNFRDLRYSPSCEPWGQDERLKAIENLNNSLYLTIDVLKFVELSIYFTEKKNVFFCILPNKFWNATQNLPKVSILSVQLLNIGKKQISLTKIVKISIFVTLSENYHRNYPWQTDNYLRALQKFINTL